MGGYGGVVLNGEKTKQNRGLNTRVKTDETKSQNENKTGPNTGGLNTGVKTDEKNIGRYGGLVRDGEKQNKTET